jgi:lipopolysaccharide transport system permease protein
MSNASNSLVGNQNLITKVYFPRLVVPISAVLAPLVDFAISFVVLIGMMIYYQIPLTPRMWALPAYLLRAMATALGVSLWLSALNVQYRDVRYAIPFLVHSGCTPLPWHIPYPSFLKTCAPSTLHSTP